MTKLLQLIIIGTALGAIYGLLALGFTLVYKATRVFNFAQGDLMMLGAYFAVMFTVTWGWNPWIAVPATVLTAIPVGWLFQRVFVRPLIGQPFLPVTMATIGGSLVLTSIIPYFWGVIERSYPTQFPEHDVGGVRVRRSIDHDRGSAACVLAFAISSSSRRWPVDARRCRNEQRS
jgi:branched-chain amino acid transport system permease protein